MACNFLWKSSQSGFNLIEYGSSCMTLTALQINLPFATTLHTPKTENGFSFPLLNFNSIVRNPVPALKIAAFIMVSGSGLNEIRID